VARGAVVRLLRDKIATQMSLNPRQRSALEMMPDVTTRRSRYHYGIIISTEVDDLDDFDPRLDRVTIDPLGERVTNRMSWYLRKVGRPGGTRAVPFRLTRSTGRSGQKETARQVRVLRVRPVGG